MNVRLVRVVHARFKYYKEKVKKKDSFFLHVMQIICTRQKKMLTYYLIVL